MGYRLRGGGGGSGTTSSSSSSGNVRHLVELADTGDLALTNASLVFQPITLSQAPIADSEIEIEIFRTNIGGVNGGTPSTAYTPLSTDVVELVLDHIETNDYLDLLPLATNQTNKTFSNRANASVANTITIKAGRGDSVDAADFSHTNFFVGRGADATQMYIACPHWTSINGNFKVVVREVDYDLAPASAAIDSLTARFTAPTNIADEGIWNRDGHLVERHVRLLAGTTAAHILYDLNHPFVEVNGVPVRNINHNSAYIGEFRLDSSRPAASANDNRYLLHGQFGIFQKSNGTDWLEYDPFASGEPWDKVYPYGAYAEMTYTSGMKQGRGIRVSMTGKLSTQIGTLGDDWELVVATDSTQSLLVSVSASISQKQLTITIKARDGGTDAPALTAIVQAINSYSTSSFSASAAYVGYVTATDKTDAGWQANGNIDFVHGSLGAVGVDLTRLAEFSEDLEGLKEGLRSAGIAGYDFGNGDLYGVYAYTAGQAGHEEATDKFYYPPGFAQVIDVSTGGRPLPGPGSRGKLFIDHYRKFASIDYRDQVASAAAAGTGTEYTNADFLGQAAHDPAATKAGQVYYNTTYGRWRISEVAIVGTGFGWGYIEFENLGTTAGLQADKLWLGIVLDATQAAAIASAEGYAATTRYYFDNIDTARIEYLSAYTAPIQQHDEWHTALLSLRNVATGSPRAYFWLNGQTDRSPDGTSFPYAATPDTNEQITFRLNGTNPDDGFDYGPTLYAGAVGDVGTLTDIGITLPIGRHDVHVVLETSSDELNTTIALMESKSGTDDRFLGRKAGEPGQAVNNVLQSARFIVPDVESDGTTQVYLNGQGWGSDTAHWRGFIMIEYRG